MSNLIEAFGFALVVAFLWFVWPPLVLLGSGVLLIVWANVRANRAAVGRRGRVRLAVSAAWRSARAVYVEPQPSPDGLRSVA